jgi:hypothetical protein
MAEQTVLEAARHEHTDVDRRILWLGAPLVLIGTIALALLVLWLYPASTFDRFMRLPLPRYPEPRLQSDPAADMARFYQEEMKRLNGTGWIDRGRGIVHIPIDSAMQQLARDGIPGWPRSDPFAVSAAPGVTAPPGLGPSRPATPPQETAP